jgi:hypothetical protein
MSKRYAKKVSSYDDEVVVVEDNPDLKMTVAEILPPVDAEDFNRQYDLTPVAAKESKRKSRAKPRRKKHPRRYAPKTYPVDPWETASSDAKALQNNNEIFFPSSFSDSSDSIERYADECLSSDDGKNDQDGDSLVYQDSNIIVTQRSTFLMPSDIHPRMEEREDDIAQLRLLAGKLNADWGAQDFMAPALARRIRDFQFAQEKRRKKYGDEKPWGILGLYEHLASIR